jgi:hypothetical protein
MIMNIERPSNMGGRSITAPFLRFSATCSST